MARQSVILDKHFRAGAAQYQGENECRRFQEDGERSVEIIVSVEFVSVKCKSRSLYRYHCAGVAASCHRPRNICTADAPCPE